jgi:hypothetical protein
MHFPLYEPGNRNQELSWVSIISIVTRLKFVIPSGLGSIRFKGIPNKEDM